MGRAFRRTVRGFVGEHSGDKKGFLSIDLLAAMTPAPYPSAYLARSSAVGLLAVPAGLFLVNGLLVLTLKGSGAPAAAYALILPLGLATAVLLVRYLAARGALPSGRQLLVLGGYAVAASIAHLLIYGTAINNDATLHAAQALHTFVSDGRFSFSEAPFVSFGDQPLAKHWLPNNLEYASTAIARIFGLSFETQTIGVTFAYNALYVAALFAVILTFVGAVPGMILATTFLAALYALIGNAEDIVGMGIFRGGENKGLIFGFYYWAVIGLCLVSPGRQPAVSAAPWVLAGFMFSAVMVSANFPVLGALALVLVLGGAVTRPLSENLRAASCLVLPIVLAAAAYTLVPGGDVMASHSDNFTPAGGGYVPRFVDIFTYPKKHWFAASAVVFLLFWFDRALALQLAAYLLAAVIAHTEWAYGLISAVLGDHAQVTWRFLILLNPFVPAIIGVAALVGRLDQARPIRLPLLGLALVALGLALRPPPPHPYVGAIRPVLPYVAAQCRPGASILTSRALGAVLPVVAPTFRILAGKDQYLNWQMGNLAPGSVDRRRARDVRDASRYLGGVQRNEPAFLAALAAEQPDIVIFDVAPTASAEASLAGYRRSRFDAPSPYVSGKTESFLIFSRPGICNAAE
ncbi:MAG: hypothetical protein CMM61_03600 [Rhodospirillaceae bacterium]|nr:hypothetical protein [Rhodospirillaceae bacterium]